MCYVLDLLIRAMTVGNCVFFLSVWFVCLFFSTCLLWGLVFITPLNTDWYWLISMAKDSLSFAAEFSTYRGLTVLWCLYGWCFVGYSIRLCSPRFQCVWYCFFLWIYHKSSRIACPYLKIFFVWVPLLGCHVQICCWILVVSVPVDAPFPFLFGGLVVLEI